MSRELRNALSYFATGVTVVTTRDGQQDHGLTVSSFNAVSLEPALVLWSVQRDSASKAAILRSQAYCVSVLSESQSALAQQFCRGTQAERFAQVGLQRAASGRAIIQGAVAWFDCELHAQVPAGDHDILIGRVVDYCATGPEQNALVFNKSQFGRFLSAA